MVQLNVIWSTGREEGDAGYDGGSGRWGGAVFNVLAYALCTLVEVVSMLRIVAAGAFVAVAGSAPVVSIADGSGGEDVDLSPVARRSKSLWEFCAL